MHVPNRTKLRLFPKKTPTHFQRIEWGLFAKYKRPIMRKTLYAHIKLAAALETGYIWNNVQQWFIIQLIVWVGLHIERSFSNHSRWIWTTFFLFLLDHVAKWTIFDIKMEFFRAVLPKSLISISTVFEQLALGVRN